MHSVRVVLPATPNLQEIKSGAIKMSKLTVRASARSAVKSAFPSRRDNFLRSAGWSNREVEGGGENRVRG